MQGIFKKDYIERNNDRHKVTVEEIKGSTLSLQSFRVDG